VSEERPSVEIFHLQDQSQVRWHEDRIGGTDMPWWFYDVRHVSKWFGAACISCIQPGEGGSFHSHMDETEGPYECWYIVLQGEGQLRTEYFDEVLPQFSAAFMPTGASHQFRNVSTKPVWWLTLSSRGGKPLKIDTYALEPEQRPGYVEEYERIMEARRRNGLPTP
jgi:mannose-6-phosphate isomerase-like protein (cupin superfamily)